MRNDFTNTKPRLNKSKKRLLFHFQSKKTEKA